MERESERERKKKKTVGIQGEERNLKTLRSDWIGFRKKRGEGSK